MAIINCTPHPINIFDRNDADSSNPRRLMLAEGAECIRTIEPSGTVLNAQRGDSDIVDMIDGVPVKSRAKFISFDALPEGDDFVIVSQLFKSAVVDCGGDTSRLLCVAETVFRVDCPTPVGCCALEVG
jgi:hypothetical protein